MFDKSEASFPSKRDTVFLAHCSVSPLYAEAQAAMSDFTQAQAKHGIRLFESYPKILPELHQSAATLLKTSAENISFVTSTAEGINMLANGYPFEPGDEILCYSQEYPANYYPWYMQQQRGVKLVLIPDVVPNSRGVLGAARGFSLNDLEALLSKRTRVLALSHVQYPNGFAAELEPIAALCKERGIDLVIDAAQSLGALPLYPEELGIAAIAASGWKWLLGPVGGSLLYTSPEFRDKIAHTMGGAELHKQAPNYHDLSWNPHQDSRRFEYSTVSLSEAVGLGVVLEKVFNRYTMESIRSELFRLQDMFLAQLNLDFYEPVRFSEANRSGILSLVPKTDPSLIANALKTRGLMIVPRAGFLRLAPHFYVSDEEVERAALLLNEIAEEQS